ncbi:ABC transporter permease [candidate division KSB1 bacterium]|nr:ABC transporter permease [candidate division KSB1 bacterium]
MKAYWAIFSARFRVLLQYRTAAIAGFGTQLFWGFIRMMIFTAFYQSTTVAQPMTLRETIIYIWLGQALLLLLPWNMDREIANTIVTGNVVYELVRPLDLYWHWFCRVIAMRTAPVLFRAVPMFLVAGLFLGLEPPPSWASAGVFLLSAFSALLLSGAITTLSSISLFWTISGEGIFRFLPSISVIFSGLIVPLPLFPDWAQPIVNFLPFRGIMDVPFRLYMGNFSPEQAPQLILHQLVWTAALVVLGRILLAKGVRRIVIQGG